MQLEFVGKTAVVTGGANGIGLEISRLLAASGASVWIFDLAAEHPEQVAASFGARGCVADVTDRESLEAAFERIGCVDVLCANAGTVIMAGVEETTPEGWDKTIRVNLTGVYHSLQIAARFMSRRRGGSIVLTASTNSFDGEELYLAYNVTKAGLMGLLRTTANELGPYGIRVNAVCPGLIRTRLTTRLFGNPESLKEYFRQIPLGRGGEPGEVASAAVFLASDAASYITGATLFVDGGQMCTKFATWREPAAEFSGDRWKLR